MVKCFELITLFIIHYNTCPSQPYTCVYLYSVWLSFHLICALYYLTQHAPPTCQSNPPFPWQQIMEQRTFPWSKVKAIGG